MRNLKFPEIDKKIQQSVYGAWGGSNSNEPPPIDGGWLDNVNVGPSGGSSGSSGGNYGSGGSWDYGDNGSYDNGGYWGDSGGSGGGSGYDLGDNYIDSTSFLNVVEGDANANDFYEVDSKIRNAVNATGLAAGFTGTAMDGLAAITKEIGFSVKTIGNVSHGIGIAGVVVGGVETYIAVAEAVSGRDPWTETDTLNAMATVLGTAALIPGPHSIICGGLSIAIGLVGTAYVN